MSMPWEDFSPSSSPSQSGPWDDFKPPANEAVSQTNSPDLSSQIQAGVQQAASSPDVQPFPNRGINPFTKPEGGPVQQVLGSMRQMASLPLRYSATLGQASQPVSEFTAEKLGGAGVNPYVSAGAGMIAGVAADPRSWTPIGGVSAEHPNELSENIAQAREARTGVKARDFQRLYKDPGAIFAGGKVEQAGQQIGAAKEAVGINPGVTNDLSTLTPENIERINPTRTMKLDDVNSVLSKVMNGQVPTPQEAQNALDSVNSILSQPSVQNNRDVFRQWSAIKTHINDALGQAAPAVRTANQAYAREKLGQTFAPMSAVNKGGTPSKLAMLAQQIPGAVGGAVGGAIAGPGGAAVGYEGGKMLSGVYHAPFIAGLQTAAGSAINKTIDPVIEALQKAGTSPQVQAFVARYLQGKNQ